MGLTPPYAGFDSGYENAFEHGCPTDRRPGAAGVFVTLLWYYAALVGVAVALGACWAWGKWRNR